MDGKILDLVEVAEMLRRSNESLKQSRRRVNDACKRRELPYRPDGRYNKRIRESDVLAYLNKGYGFHGRPVKKRPVNSAKELAKATAQLAKAQRRVEALTQTVVAR